jgi:outer membrane protein TolC
MAEGRYFTDNAMAPDENFSRWDLMVKQDFPFPKVLVLRGDAATKAAEAEALRYEAAVRDAVAELKDAHAERTYLAEAAKVQAALLDVYRRYAELARGAAGTGRTRLPEAFRAEALLAQAEYELTILSEVRAAEDQRLRSMLAIPRTTRIGDPADAVPSVPFDVDLDRLAARALERNQEVRAAGVEIAAATIGKRLAEWDYAPQFSIGAGKMFNDEFDMATGDKEDSAVVTFGMTLPIWYGAKSAAVREAEAKVRASQAAEAGERERVATDVARLGFRLRNASRLSVLYGRELVPQAEKALLRSQAMVREGNESLSSSLELAATWQQLRIAELRARADEAQAIAALERVLGASLELAPAAQGTPR